MTSAAGNGYTKGLDRGPGAISTNIIWVSALFMDYWLQVGWALLCNTHTALVIHRPHG
jgi:hypothetical protein